MIVTVYCLACSWLSGLGLGVYVDDFHQRGLTLMSHLQHFTVDVSIIAALPNFVQHFPTYFL